MTSNGNISSSSTGVDGGNGHKSEQRGVDFLHIPSVTMKRDFLTAIRGCCFYEERLLCFLLHLNDPNSRVIYVTSLPLSPSVVDYFLSLLTEVTVEDAKKRLFMISCYDVGDDSLCQKLLNKPRTISRIRELIDPKKTILSTYIHTELEIEVSARLGLNQGTSPANSFWGTKLGSRMIFSELNIPHCYGVLKQLNSTENIVENVVAMRQKRPDLGILFIKYMEGVSGLGNALWRLPESNDPKDVLRSLQHDLEPVGDMGPMDFLANVPKLGAIVEECIEEKGLESPSVQGLIDDNGAVHVVSSHEQVLHGHGIYEGCSFPAHEAYRMKLHDYCQQVGELLARKGSRGERFGVDFVAWQNQEGEWQLKAIEINLRHLGTTHPMVTMELVTVGGHLAPDGTFVDRFGRSRCYLASDNFHHSSLKSLTPDDLFDLVGQHPELQYDKEQTTGVIFHMINSLSSFGKVGILSIADTVEKALERCAIVKKILVQEAQGTKL